MAKSQRSKSLEGMNAIVTGASRGIGYATAYELANRGASVALLGKNQERLSLAEEKLGKAFGKKVFKAQVDVTDPKSVGKAMSAARQELGKIHILVNNAGAGVSAPFVKSTLDSWRQMIDVNLTSAFLCIHEILSSMMDEKNGRIINVSSTAGLRGYKYVSAYCAAKHGVIGLTKSLALEVASHGITVNAVCPGFTETDMLTDTVAKAASKTGKKLEEIRKELMTTNPQGRFIQPEEVASTIAWLCEPEQKSITGQAISISGGEI